MLEISPLSKTLPNNNELKEKNKTINEYIDERDISNSHILKEEKYSINKENINENENKENIPSLKTHSFISIKSNGHKIKNKLPLINSNISKKLPECPKNIKYDNTQPVYSSDIKGILDNQKQQKNNALSELKLEYIKRKTITRGTGQEIKNVQITHIISTSKPSDFHITEKLSTNNIQTNPIQISKTFRENIPKNGKFSHSSSCNDKIKNTVHNLKGKTTVYQHARGIGMTNDRRGNINPLFYNSEIKKLDPIVKEKEKVKVEYIENFRSNRYRNHNDIVNSTRNLEKENNYKNFNTVSNVNNRNGINTTRIITNK
jgi:hypothetical protein